ncbi:Crp/Fnr family transcriptional regulator [uncultured Ilyobacter sp.]|uniref:Crp/Fnr family transcriptional regulator n=1 Tax=uncultured Ilyobacter sp. TaxID=544433 RepID=UPI0029C73FCC|nr:Crp/Fnr family transcriptional regulator [uncultured Ilyobacter sp.]
MNREYLELFDKTKFEEVSNFFLNKVGVLGKIKKFFKNDILCFDAGKELLIIQNGEIDVSLEEISGKEQLIYRIKSGGVLGEIEMLSNLTQNYTIHFTKDTQISFVPKIIVQKLLKTNPDYYLYFTTSMARAYNITLLHLVYNKFYSSEERIVEFILRIGATQDPNKVKNILIEGYTHENIASNTNTSRYLVTKIFNKLKDRKIIEINPKKIFILDIDKLKEYREKIRKD